MKYVKTPFAIFAGSINISFNGLSGRNQESASLYFPDTNEQDYRQAKSAIENTLVGSKVISQTVYQLPIGLHQILNLQILVIQVQITLEVMLR